MKAKPAQSACRGFTLVELLLAMTLGVLAVAICGALLHGIFSATRQQSAKMAGPEAAQHILRRMAAETACAFAPPGETNRPFILAASFEADEPETTLSFYYPQPDDSGVAGFYRILHVRYEVIRRSAQQRELRRIEQPITGPASNHPATNILLSGDFTLRAVIPVEADELTDWPPPLSESPGLPETIQFSLKWEEGEAAVIETVIHAAHSIPSPLQRDAETSAAGADGHALP